jgi:Primase C terminal 2 (PriCT-2)
MLVNADPTAKTPVHPLRWPGSWHLKSHPKLCCIATLHEVAEVHLPVALDMLQEAVEAAGILRLKNSDGPKISGAPEASLEIVRGALEAISNPDLHWDDWVKVGLLVYAATGASSDGLEAWIKWSQKSNKFQPGACEERWAHFATSPPTKGGAGTLIMMAQQTGWKRAPQKADERFRIVAREAFRLLKLDIPSSYLVTAVHRHNETQPDPLPPNLVDRTILWAARKRQEQPHAA